MSRPQQGSGQSAADYADGADNLAHGFKALLCRVRSSKPGCVVPEFVRRDALTGIVLPWRSLAR